MGSMMGWMTAVGWLVGVLVLVVLIAAILALVRLLRPDLGIAEGVTPKILIIVFAVIGVFAVLGVLGKLFGVVVLDASV